jgi:diphosphomevalonate decarboxylase
MSKATAVANPNIAFIKYWGKIDDALNLPANPSVSMNLAALTTVTTVEFQPGLRVDTVTIDGKPAVGEPFERVVAHLERVRLLAGTAAKACVRSQSDFPVGTGLASSSSAFAALSLAATRAAGLDLDERELSRLARLGSGSACRSVPSGFSLWEGDSDENSFAEQVAGRGHWDLVDVVAIVAYQHKAVGSQQGHGLASTSPLREARLAAVPGWLEAVLQGIRDRDIATLGPSAEADALAMHGVMMTSEPSLLYWMPATVSVLQSVRSWRQEGMKVYFTLDAGPNVHCLCESADAAEVQQRLRNLAGVEDVLISGVGAGVRLVAYHLF